MQNPLINILVRTSNRPNYFTNCYQSIREQTYKNNRLIVGHDDEPTRAYLKDYDIDALLGFKRMDDWSGINEEIFVPGFTSKPFPPNEYFNRMMKETRSGYIIMLDDDNVFSSQTSLVRIAEHISNHHQMLFWRVQFPNYLVPDNQHFGLPPQCCQIDTAGFAFPTEYIKYALWDKYSLGDFRTALSLSLRIPQKIYINEVLTSLQGNPGSGMRNDLPSSNTGNHEV